MEFLLPLNSEGEAGGVKQEFAAARDMVEATLLQLKQRSEFAVCFPSESHNELQMFPMGCWCADGSC